MIFKNKFFQINVPESLQKIYEEEMNKIDYSKTLELL